MVRIENNFCRNSYKVFLFKNSLKKFDPLKNMATGGGCPIATKKNSSSETIHQNSK